MNLKPMFLALALSAAVVASAAELKWAKDYKSAVSAAKKTSKIVMVDFTAVWCVNCHKLEKTTYRDPQVVKLLASTIPVQVDYDKQPALAKKYKAKALPVIVFLDGNGRELGRITGYKTAKQFIQLAKPILEKVKR